MIKRTLMTIKLVMFKKHAMFLVGKEPIWKNI